MKSREAIPMIFHVNPSCDLLLGKLALGVLDQQLKRFKVVVEGALMQQSLPVGVRDVAHHQV